MDTVRWMGCEVDTFFILYPIGQITRIDDGPVPPRRQQACRGLL